VYNLYHPLNCYLVLVICCIGDENSGNFFFTHDNENRNVIWFFWWKFPSCLSVLIWMWLCYAPYSQLRNTVTWCWN